MSDSHEDMKPTGRLRWVERLEPQYRVGPVTDQVRKRVRVLQQEWCLVVDDETTWWEDVPFVKEE